MIKLIVTDLDGTLLNSSRELSETNKKTIAKLQTKGYLVCFASGRPHASVKEVAKRANLMSNESYLITNTGSGVYDLKKDEFICSNTLSIDTYWQILEFIKQCKVQLTVYTENKLISFDENINDALYHDQDILKMPIEVMDPSVFNEAIGRLNVMGTKKEIDAAIKLIPKKILEQYYFVRNEDFSFEILNKNAGKGNALRFLCDYLKIDLFSEVLTIGDNFNDLEMLEITGYSVAMGQSAKAIKQVTKYTTLSNDEDGFTHAIDAYVLGGINEPIL